MAISMNSPTGVTSNPVSNSNVNTPYNRISTGQRINSAADDAAGLAISNKMATQLGGLNTAIRNAGDGISLVQVETGALTSVNANLQRMRELSVQAGNGALNASDRKALQKEADQLLDDTKNILETSSFNGKQLLNSDTTQPFQVGPNVSDVVSIEGKNIQGLLEQADLFDLDLTTPDAASHAIGVLDVSLTTISERSAELGAVANRFESTINNLQDARINTAEARSRIADADIAKEASDLAANQIKNQVQIAIQAQANSSRGLVLQLLT
ncbi:flagellin N-terminal helical domain-containing protein [Alkalimarinus alittae]|uniref:Flagellin n=1 Tax=Alkalimarinus alittae TaxID=2961619 RepID=A0ABY6N3S6_9ALTE|nr:flagellin [Alkalimarinus alittae]UZE96777.1 flagellin [Alkalimarinus alittae]